MKPLTPEGQVKETVRVYLRTCGWFVFHVPGNMYGRKGASDYIALKHGRTIYVEVKAPGETQTPDQVRFQRDIEDHGGEYILVYGVQDLIDKGVG